MAPAADYLFLSIETLVNTVSLITMAPCILTLLRTQGIHDNCKLLLVTSACVNTLILCVQTVLFAYNFISGNLMPEPADRDFPDQEKPFLVIQNILFTMSSYISVVLVMERMFAVRHAAVYERSGRHLVALLILIAGCLIMGMIHVYGIYWHNLIFQSIAVTYAVEGCTLIISLAIIIYSGRKLQRIPFGDDRLKAVKEVLNFSLAILPSVVVSSVMHTLSLVPTMLWQAGVISYPVCCLVYFTVHSLNCIFTKLVLIGCHKGMRQRFLMLFFSQSSSSTIVPIKRDAEKEAREYFDHMRASWDSVPAKGEKSRGKWKMYKAMKKISAVSVSASSQ